MFRKKEKSGKVTMIHVPVYMLEQLDIMPVYIFHEAFHVLTKKERNRERRCECYLKLMVAAIEQAAFAGINLSEYNDTNSNTISDEKGYNSETEDKLMERWFFDLDERVKSIFSSGVDERFFYSEAMRTMAEQYFNEKLKFIQLNFPNQVEGFLIDKIKSNNFDDFNESYENMRKNIQHIRENVMNMILNRSVESFSGMFLDLFRECYADICCVLTIGITREQYFAAFDRSIPVPVLDQNGDDFVKWMRIILVSSTVRDIKSYLDHNGENHYEDHLESWDSAETPDLKNVSVEPELYKAYMSFTPQMTHAMKSYLKKCAEDFLDMINQDEGVREIRQVVREVMDADRYQEEIHKILNGGSRAYFNKKK